MKMSRAHVHGVRRQAPFAVSAHAQSELAARTKDAALDVVSEWARTEQKNHHIWFVVDMGLRTLVQHCHDEDCRRSHYAMAIPGEIFQSLPADKKEAVGGQALQVGRKVETEKNN